MTLVSTGHVRVVTTYAASEGDVDFQASTERAQDATKDKLR